MYTCACEHCIFVKISVYLLVFFLKFYFRTSLGRGRAWLRLALMQKKLADYFRGLMEHKDMLRYVNVMESGKMNWGESVIEVTDTGTEVSANAR